MKNALMKTVRLMFGQGDIQKPVEEPETNLRFQYTKDDNPAASKKKPYSEMSQKELLSLNNEEMDKALGKPTAKQWAKCHILSIGYVEISYINKKDFGGGGYNLNDPRTPVIRAVNELEKEGYVIKRPKVPKKDGGYIVRYTLVK